MLIPFDSKYAENYVSHILRSDDAVLCIRNTLKALENCEDNISVQLCYEVWTAALLFDSAVNSAGTPDGCSENFLPAVRKIQEDFQKTKRYYIFRKIPVHDIVAVSLALFDALMRIIVPDPEEIPPEDYPRDEDGEVLSGLGALMQEQGKLDEWTDDIFYLQSRLEDSEASNFPAHG